MKYNFFTGKSQSYHVSTYFYRIEFQQRGAPHVHSLLWLQNEKNEDAPNFWVGEEEENLVLDEEQSEQKESSDINKRVEEMEKFADCLISTSPDEIHCDEHENNPISKEDQCGNCLTLQEKVKKYQTHGHTFTCAKKRKCLTIKEM